MARRLGRVVDDPDASASGPAAAVSRGGGRLGLGRGRAGQLDEQPAAARGAGRERPGPRAPDHVDDAGVHALEGDRAMRQDRAGRRRPRRPCPGSRGRPATVAAGASDQPDGRPEDHAPACPRCRPGPWPGRTRSRAAGAPASSRRPGGRSGRTRCGSRPRCGPDEPRPGPAPPPTAPGAGRPGARAGAGDHVERQRRCRRCARRRARASRRRCCRSCRRGCSGCGWRVGAEAQPVRRGGGAAASSRTTPGSTRAVRASGSSDEHPVQVPGEVQDHAGADGVAGDRGARAPGGQRDAQLPGRPRGRRRPRRRRAGRRPARGTTR